MAIHENRLLLLALIAAFALCYVHNSHDNRMPLNDVRQQ
jgi:hypothetical protein